MDKPPVILTQMTRKEPLSWEKTQKHTDKRLLRNTSFLAAVSLCLGLCAYFAAAEPQRVKAVMGHLRTGFEYDETLGRLHLVSNLLPESAMVFLNTTPSDPEFHAPTQIQASHHWTQQEPWLEYACIGNVDACQAGEVITVVKNHTGSHTMRIMHENGYESIYSGLETVHVREHDVVLSGQSIGTSAGHAAFELRKDGISVLPVFSAQ